MHRALLLSSVFVFVAILTPWEAPKAAVLHTLVSPNEESDGYFGYSVSGAGDTNNDGWGDVIVGAYHEDGGFPDAGRAYVFNGQTGTVLQTITSPNAGADGHLGYSVSGAGDVNNDGYDDVVVGAPDEDVGMSEAAGRAYVISGQTGGLLHTLVSPNAEESGKFGWSVSGAGDVNDDGFDDVIVGAPFEDVEPGPDAGRAYVFDGETGVVIWSSPTGGVRGNWGYSVSGIGDANGDGHAEFVIGAPYDDDYPLDPQESGRAWLFDGQSGTLIEELESPNHESFGHFGWSVSGAGDANNDGQPDVVVGACFEDLSPSLADAGQAYVFDGTAGNLLLELQSPNAQTGGCFGAWVSGAGDVNNGGYDDVIIGAFLEDALAADAGRAYIFSGQAGAQLSALLAFEGGGRFGNSVSWMGDIDGDGCDDVVVGAPNQDPGASPQNAGRAYVYSISPASMVLSGTLSGSDLVLEWTSCPETYYYFIYGAANNVFFDPSSPVGMVPPGTTTWSSAAGVGYPQQNWTYLVIAVNSVLQEITHSNRLGEFDFETAIP